MSLLEYINKKYETAWKRFVRPERMDYPNDQLCSNICTSPSEVFLYKRMDLRIPFRTYTLACTLLQAELNPHASLDGTELAPVRDSCVLYLHSFNGCQMEGVFLFDLLLDTGFSICLMDFGGAGHSTGDYITLGYHEVDQAIKVISVLKDTHGINRILTWGRSMGAATSLMIAAGYPSMIKAMILDTPFSRLENTLSRIIQTNTGLPSIVVKGALKIMKSSVLENAGVDIEKINPIDNAHLCRVPALFIKGKEEELITEEEFTELYIAYGAEKERLNAEGSHSCSRKDDAELHKKAKEFILKHLGRVSKPIFKKLSVTSIDIPNLGRRISNSGLQSDRIRLSSSKAKISSNLQDSSRRSITRFSSVKISDRGRASGAEFFTRTIEQPNSRKVLITRSPQCMLPLEPQYSSIPNFSRTSMFSTKQGGSLQKPQGGIYAPQFLGLRNKTSLLSIRDPTSITVGSTRLFQTRPSKVSLLRLKHSK